MAADASPSVVRIADLAAQPGEFTIAGEEAHYLARVVRVRAGERVRATDGRGTLATLEVLETGASCRVRVHERETAERPATLELWCGAPEGDRADWLVEKLGELGVATFVPLETARVRWERAAARRERWERLAVAALRQSRSAWQLEIRTPVRLADALAAAPAGGRRWICRPDGAPWPRTGARAPGTSVAVIGPSSGFTADELNVLAEAGFDPLALGASRLRTETAAMTVAALWATADNG